MTHTKQTQSQIYITCLASYNSGILHGEWITPSTDEDTLNNQIMKVINSSPMPDAEEWAVHDYDNFANLGEYPGLEDIIKIQIAINEHGADIVNSFIDDFSIEDIESLEDAYSGHYDSFLEFATQLALDTIDGLEDNNGPLARHFSFKDYAWDLKHDYLEHDAINGGVLVFNRNI
tara:strand:- start:319 stop:843 length:525 start_codon:yes stop_codon:yes gene_type:complete